ncbi:SpoIIIAH-like family protein [Crassaminicella thermophila]|uniref:SpoIIIAH-like family protein n=1 Tax=Crassaminicella thermophila TaxID=2599308 RepID=A0A5C0SEI1_CRATE|nr:SpoIIIAH-like family protein [Crassaminicella thermophila]QEK12147.1 SpoIIIAH-like family protein [Crassaminicella thermophila]
MLKIKKRNIFVFSLVLVLCFIGYLNYAINRYTLLETSSDFEKYEENKLAEVNLENENKEISSKDIESNICVEQNDATKEVVVVDSNKNQIEDIISETSQNIKETISNTKNIKRTNYFIESRLSMDLERERIISLLNEIINNDRTDESNRKAANDQKMKLIDIMNKEKITENLIKAKGFEDALVFITDQSVNVIVETEKLIDSDVAKILDIVMRETKFTTDNIKISNIY